MTVPRERLLDLIKAQCRIFSTSFNPEGVRTGNKILHQRLKGPSVAAYYPRRTVTYKDLAKAFPDLSTWNDKEEDRLEGIEIAKSRGKGAPKKKSGPAEKSKYK